MKKREEVRKRMREVGKESRGEREGEKWWKGEIDERKCVK